MTSHHIDVDNICPANDPIFSATFGGRKLGANNVLAQQTLFIGAKDTTFGQYVQPTNVGENVHILKTLVVGNCMYWVTFWGPFCQG